MPGVEHRERLRGDLPQRNLVECTAKPRPVRLESDEKVDAPGVGPRAAEAERAFSESSLLRFVLVTGGYNCVGWISHVLNSLVTGEELK